MGPWRGLFGVLRAEPAGGHRDHVVVQLSAQADRVHVVVIQTRSRLMAVAQVEGLDFAERGVAYPDAIAGPSAGPPPG